MKAGPGTSQVPARQYLWVAVSVLLGLGVITTTIDLVGVSADETKAALDHQQRIIIDAATGAVSGADRPQITQEQPQPSSDFEVGEESEAVAPAPTSAPPVVAEPIVEAPVTPAGEEEASAVMEEAPVAESAPDDDNAPSLATSPMMSDIPKVERTKDSLVTAPAPEVSEITPQGALPKRGEGENVTPAMIYSRSYTRNDEIATLHFVIIGLGFSSDTLALAQQLPGEVSFAFSPYGESLAEQIEASRNDGHEVWTLLPTQTALYPQHDPGPLGLIATLSDDVFDARFKKILLSMPGTVGVIFPADETLSTMPKVFSAFLEQLKGLGLIAVSTHPTRTVKELSAEKEIRKMLAKSDMVLDDVPNAAVIKSKLAGLMDKTKERRQMVVVMHARPQTIILVKDWLARTKYEGVELAPLSAKILRPPKMLTPDDVEEAPTPAAAHGETKPAAAGGH